MQLLRVKSWQSLTINPFYYSFRLLPSDNYHWCVHQDNIKLVYQTSAWSWLIFKAVSIMGEYPFIQRQNSLAGNKTSWIQYKRLIRSFSCHINIINIKGLHIDFIQGHRPIDKSSLPVGRRSSKDWWACEDINPPVPRDGTAHARC